MDATVEAWNSMTYFDGFLFTLWIIGLYYLKCKMDSHFMSKRKNLWKIWKNSIKESVKEALSEYYESGVFGEKK